MILLLYTYFDSALSGNAWRHYLDRVSGPVQKRINRYRRWQDRQAALFAKLLLLEGLREYRYNDVCIDDLLYNKFGRPFLNLPIDFNISHSHAYVVCTITKRGRMGIDIEKIRSIDLSGFKRYLTREEWGIIQEATSPYEKFYEYWTIKESVMKADGGGLSIPLHHIHINGNQAKLYHVRWLLEEIRIDSDYKCHLATNLKNSGIRLRRIQFH
jgi:4'-phosphopantetheinyl transferase